MFPRVVSHVVAVVIIVGMRVPKLDFALSRTSSILMYLSDRGDCRGSVSALRFMDSISDTASLDRFLLIPSVNDIPLNESSQISA